MARRRKIAVGNFERINLTLTEEIACRLNTFLDNHPYTDKNKTIRQAIHEFLDARQPSELKQLKTN